LIPECKVSETGNLLAGFERDGIGHGERWGVCAARWLEAGEDGLASLGVAEATHRRALQKDALAARRYRARCDYPGEERPAP
jgi:uncharacterized protein (DUF2237 family)